MLTPLPENPLVSIIVPSYNQGRFIGQTLDSIITQDYRPLEVIVIDGASTDETQDMLHRYDTIPEVTWISEPDSGVVEAVNKGFARARGDIGGIQSSDDCYLPGAIRTGVKTLTSDRSLGFVFGDIIKSDAEGRELSRTRLIDFSLENILSVITWIPQPSTFFRMGIAKALGGWREEVPYAADTDLWMRMMLKAGAKKIDSLLASRRIHDAQRDLKGDLIIRDYAKTIRDLFEQFGAPGGLRPAAEAGLLLTKNRYTYDERPEIKAQRMRQALDMYPPLAAYLSVPSSVPGLDLMRHLGRALRERLLESLKIKR